MFNFINNFLNLAGRRGSEPINQPQLLNRSLLLPSLFIILPTNCYYRSSLIQFIARFARDIYFADFMKVFNSKVTNFSRQQL